MATQTRNPAAHRVRGAPAAKVHGKFMRSQRRVRALSLTTLPRHIIAKFQRVNSHYAVSQTEYISIRCSTTEKREPVVKGRGAWKCWVPRAVLRCCFGNPGSCQPCRHAASYFSLSVVSVRTNSHLLPLLPMIHCHLHSLHYGQPALLLHGCVTTVEAWGQEWACASSYREHNGSIHKGISNKFPFLCETCAARSERHLMLHCGPPIGAPTALQWQYWNQHQALPGVAPSILRN